MSFLSLGLRPELVRAVSEKGYATPTPIQIQAIPLILEGRDLMGSAQTGTGKTAGFTLPILQRLDRSGRPAKGRRAIRALTVVPTRELAMQVHRSVEDYGKWLHLESAAVFGGVNINPQKKKLARGVDFLVATPGRLLDLVNQDSVDLSRIEILVLDEADRMLDMGFIRDIRKLLALLPRQKQTLLFSATFSEAIKQLAGGLLHSPALVEIGRRNGAVESVEQLIYPVEKGRKRELLSELIGTNNWRQVLVFGRTKHGANRLAKQLNTDGISATAIHGNKSQSARTQALAKFKAGKVQVLVATDIAARGLDIEQLPHVINFELPQVAEDYVHRIGRTGRAGRRGHAISLVCYEESGQLRDIERLIKREIPRQVVAGYAAELSRGAPKVNANKKPNKRRRRSGSRRRMAA
ncbi:MAG: DEAD/DEAH box helicase [Gammaproteobacteria bacterium]|nr:MAG: DEAD/DEAH box helicase [Gammaproteobacteria bacterium]